MFPIIAHRSRCAAVALAAILLTSVGCGGGNTAKGTTVKGLITVKGQPASGVIVNFHGENNLVSSTTAGPDGRYVLEGVQPGAVKVSLMSVSGMPGGGKPGSGAGATGMPGMPGGAAPKKGAEAPKGTPAETVAKVVDVPAKYSKPDSSGLNYTVEGKEQMIDIDIK